MFRGVFADFAAVADERPWSSAAYRAASSQLLRECQAGVTPPGSATPNAVIAFILNTLGGAAPPRVLDWAGGTGLRYWSIRDTLNRPVQWHVVDDPALARLSDQVTGPVDAVAFAAALPPPGSTTFDLVLVYSSLQYVESQADLLAHLASFRPRYILLPRLMARRGSSYVTCQSVYGRDTPCKVSSLEEIGATLDRLSYRPVLSIRDGLDLSPMFDDDVPTELRVGKEWLLVFREAS